MKKILVFGLTSTIGGVETFFMSYYRQLKKEKYNIDFITVYENMAFKDEIIKNGGKVYKVTNFINNPIKYAIEIDKIIKFGKYDTVYVNMLSAANIIPLKIAKKNKINNIICHSHNANIPNSKIKKILHKFNKSKIKKYANILVACSEKAGNWMFEKENYLVLNNAIDCKKFAYNDSYNIEIRERLKIDKNRLVIGHIGRFSEQKNHKFIIDIMYELTQSNLNALFILIGDGEDKEKIVSLIHEKKLENNVLIFNGMSDVYKLYNVFDIFILPSLFEGLPIVGVEAQANGLYSIFSDEITKEIKINDNVCFLPINEAKMWAEAIKTKVRRTNKLKVSECGFDINLNISKMVDILEGKF